MSAQGTRKIEWEPPGAVGRIADAGMKAMEAQAEAEGVDMHNALIMLAANGVPEGEDDAMTHPHMRMDREPDWLDVLAFACSHVRSLAKAVGANVDIRIGGVAVGRPTPRTPRGRRVRRGR